MNESTHNARLQARVGLRVNPNSFEIGGTFSDIGERQRRSRRCRSIVRGVPNFTYLRKCPAPPRAATSRFCGAILPEGPISIVTGSLEIARQRVTNLITATGGLCLGLDDGRNCTRLDDRDEGLLNPVIDAQSAEGDATRLAIVEQAAPTGISGNIMLGASVAHCQFESAVPAANESCEESIAVLRGVVMPTDEDIVAHLSADNLRTLLADITFMRPGN